MGVARLNSPAKYLIEEPSRYAVCINIAELKKAVLL
jgi:hypothetical protein